MGNPPTQQLWTKDFTLLCIANLMIFTSFYCLLPTLPVYITEVLHGDPSAIGFIFGVFALSAVVARPLAGYLSDVVGRKAVLVVALLALLLVMASYYFVTSLTLLFLVRAMHGLSFGFTTTASGTLAADIVPETKRGEGLGYYSLSNTLAMAVGPGLGLAILGQASFSVLFTSCLAIAAAGFAFVPGINAPPIAKGKSKNGFCSSDLFEIRVLPQSLITFCVAWLYGGIISFIALFGKQIGIENVGSYFLAYAAALVLSRPYAGMAYDREGPMRIMLIGFMSLTGSFIFLYFSDGYGLFLLSAASLGVGFGIVQSTVLTMAIDKIEPFRRGVATGTVFTAFDLGIGLGSIGLGVISKHFGLQTMYLVCAICSVIPAILFFISGGNSYSVEVDG